MSALPRDFDCPHCGAHKGRGCHSKGKAWGAKTHQRRWDVAGIPKPSYDDIHRDYVDGQERDLQARLELYRNLRKIGQDHPS